MILLMRKPLNTWHAAWAAQLLSCMPGNPGTAAKQTRLPTSGPHPAAGSAPARPWLTSWPKAWGMQTRRKITDLPYAYARGVAPHLQHRRNRVAADRARVDQVVVDGRSAKGHAVGLHRPRLVALPGLPGLLGLQVEDSTASA